MTNQQLRFWARFSLLNLCVAAGMGLLLRTKFLFPMPQVNYSYFLSSHSHFAFGGWVSLALMALMVREILPARLGAKKAYQWILWSISLSSWGMVASFPFGGYKAVSIIFSTLFIFSTYWFSAVFLKHLWQRGVATAPLRWLGTGALLSLVLSSVGPFTLAWILATGSANSWLYKDAIYTFLHLMYNGFFTLSVLMLFIHRAWPVLQPPVRRRLRVFALLLSASVLPSLALTLLWHPQPAFVWVLAALGTLLMLLAVIWLLRMLRPLTDRRLFQTGWAHALWLLVLLSFVVKMVLQTGTIIPELGHAVFGYRPIIIGFLHLVFLGLASFFILARYLEHGLLQPALPLSRLALGWFAGMVLLQEAVLLVQGLFLLAGANHWSYAWLLWIAAIGLFIGSVLLFAAGLASSGGRPGNSGAGFKK